MEKQVLDFNVLIEQDEDGIYVATVPELEGCHTQGNSLNQVLERIKEAIEVCIESDEEIAVPMKFIGIQKVQVKNPLAV